MFKVKCSKCGSEFDAQPGEVNSTVYLGKVSMLYGVGGYLPECPQCGNWRDNRIVKKDGSLSEALRM